MKRIIYLCLFLLMCGQNMFAQQPQIRKKALNLPPKSVFQNGFYTGKELLMKISEKETTFLYVNGKKQGICSNLEDVSPENSLARTIVATEKMPQTGYQTTIYFGANKKWENLPFPQVKIYFDKEDTIVECWKNPRYLKETRFLNGNTLVSADSLHQKKVILNANGKGYFVWHTDNQKVWEENKEMKFPLTSAQTATASQDGKNWIWAAQEQTVLAIYFNGNRVFGIPSISKDSLIMERIILAPDGKEYAFQATYFYTKKSFIFFSNRKIKEIEEVIVPNSLCYGIFYPKTWSWLSYQTGENPMVFLHHSAQKTDILPPYFEEPKNMNPPHFIWDSKRENALLSYNKKNKDVIQNHYFVWQMGKFQEKEGANILKMDLSEQGNFYLIERTGSNSSDLFLQTPKIKMAFFAKNQNLIFSPSENFWWTASSEWFDEIKQPNSNVRSEIHYEKSEKKAFWLEYNEKGEIFTCERALP